MTMGHLNPKEFEDPYGNKRSEIPNPKPSDGGPSTYYDFPPWLRIRTLNDLMEYKAKEHWGPFSLHMKDAVKACWRFGTKQGIDYSYDARKIVYSGLRLLVMIKGVKEAEDFIDSLSRDPQFRSK